MEKNILNVLNEAREKIYKTSLRDAYRGGQGVTKDYAEWVANGSVKFIDDLLINNGK